MKTNEYNEIIVVSYIPNSTSGKHGEVHVRPLPNQDPYLPQMNVECSKVLSNDYPVGTKFKIKAKISSRDGGTPFIYSHYSWKYDVSV